MKGPGQLPVIQYVETEIDIQKGSRIIWEGEPTSANVDIAVYTRCASN